LEDKIKIKIKTIITINIALIFRLMELLGE
jgi:hypothetical protein